MSSVLTEAKHTKTASKSEPVVNDVVIKMATMNGSGSQSANFILLRAIFHMGILVSGRNRFPSNIEGLPTWFTIRVNADGWLGERVKTDVLVAMNASTIDDDLSALEPGAIVVMNETLKTHVTRDDLEVYAIPFAKLAKEVCPNSRLRKKLANVIYVGVLAWLLDIEMDEIFKAVDYQFSSKPKAAIMNKDAARVGFDWAFNNFEMQKRFRLERRVQASELILIEGNEAAALGLLFGGASVLAWYPITPSSSVCESLTDYFHQYRRDPDTGKTTYAVIQAEDEIASIGIVLGAGWAGARACTATSGPGLSLMAEMAGLSYFAEVPAVIVDIQRMGPSTGLPTRTAQSDILPAYYLSHGDCRHVLLIPGNVEECYEFARESLDLAARLQTLVLLMSDLDLGMNKWLSKPFEAPSAPLDRGKVLTAEDVERLGVFERYADVDGDGIPYRTLPGTPHPKAAYFTRGTGHTPQAGYSESSANWKENMDRLAVKFETAREMVPRPVLQESTRATVGFIAYGSSDLAVEEARHLLDTRHKLKTSYLRLRALPVNGEVKAFIEKYDRVYVIEQNRDAQMATILRSEYPKLGGKLRSVLHYDGLSIDAENVVTQILEQEE